MYAKIYNYVVLEDFEYFQFNIGSAQADFQIICSGTDRLLDPLSSPPAGGNQQALSPRLSFVFSGCGEDNDPVLPCFP